jgi:hypothetical protein
LFAYEALCTKPCVIVNLALEDRAFGRAEFAVGYNPMRTAPMAWCTRSAREELLDYLTIGKKLRSPLYMVAKEM